MLSNERLSYVYRLAKESERMLRATLSHDTDTMTEILEFVHNTESPIFEYNNETELSAVVNLVYLSARDKYRVEREDKEGKGFVDFVFYPERRHVDAIILELKIDSTPEDAIQQIKDKNYALCFKGKLGEEPPYTGKILAVGISYNKKSKINTQGLLFTQSSRKNMFNSFFNSLIKKPVSQERNWKQELHQKISELTRKSNEPLMSFIRETEVPIKVASEMERIPRR